MNNNMTPEETLYFEQAKAAVNQQSELFKQQEEAVRNNIMRRFGADSAAITIRDQIRDSNLSLSAVLADILNINIVRSSFSKKNWAELQPS